MSLDWRVVPIKKWPGEQTPERRTSLFSRAVTAGKPTYEGGSGTYTRRVSGVDWDKTVRDLERELDHLEATGIVLQMNVVQRDIRGDGWIRANARPEHPGVIISFTSRTLGPLSYPCDTYDDWQANVRAIMLSLEALRAVDRHGVTKRGEQYQGFTQIGAGKLIMTPQLAAEILTDVENLGGDPTDLLAAAVAVKYTYREAVKKAHPDAGGSAETFQRVQEAKEVLDRYHGDSK